MNLEDVLDMNVGDMVNECTSEDNASYMEHLVLLLSLIRHVIIIFIQQDIIILVQDIRIYPLISERLSD